MNYIVYTEILENGTCERWYYGTYTEARANEVAEMLGSEYPVFHCVCAENEIESLHILNV